MNYARLGDWVLERVEDLVQFGVPRAEAEALLVTVERGAIASEARCRNDDQFLLDFKIHGAAAMAERYRKTPQAMRDRRARILKNKAPLARTLSR
jgi:hypothetical protein